MSEEEPAKTLDTLALDVDIGSREQLSVDQLTRSRLQFVLGQNAAIVQQIQFADAKAATLLALTGVLAYGLTYEVLSVPLPILAVLLGLTGAVIALCLLAVMPRIRDGGSGAELYKRDPFSWPALSAKGFDADTHADFLRTSQASHLVMAVARSNVAIAAVLSRKYSLLRAALWLAIADLVVIFAAAGLQGAGLV
ncbi:MAG: Pycsar system effector family protein [Pseudomonadota bacterium]